MAGAAWWWNLIIEDGCGFQGQDLLAAWVLLALGLANFCVAGLRPAFRLMASFVFRLVMRCCCLYSNLLLKMVKKIC